MAFLTKTLEQLTLCFGVAGLIYLTGLFTTSYLSNLIFIPLVMSLVIACIPKEKEALLKEIALVTASFTFLYSLLLWVFFNLQTPQFQYVESFSYLFPMQDSKITIFLGVDGISMPLIILSNLLIFICLLSSWSSIKIYLKEYLIAFLVLEAFLVGAFAVLDLLIFYIFFEATLLPMFIIVLIYGSRERKAGAANFLFLYTFFGSLFMLAAILYIYSQFGTTNYLDLIYYCPMLSATESNFLWFAFFFSFATKLPMIPFHIWLPEAHVEAPTAGSVILAGILLKLGSYGMIRYALALLPSGALYFTPLVYTLSILGVIYASLTAIRQTDFKRIVAYSSVAHMSIVNIGIFAFNSIGLEGALLQSVSHGFVASALFLIIGVVYDRFHSRIVKYYGGLATYMPLYAIVFLFFTMANIALPGTSSFVGEILILAGSFKANTTVTFLGATGMILGGAYALWLANRILYGNLKVDNGRLHLNYFYDLTRREIYVFLPLILGTLWLGIYPKPLLDVFHISVQFLVYLIQPFFL